MFKSQLRDEKGMAMIVVVGIMLILTVLAFSSMAISENDIKLSTRDKESMEALHIADAGIQKALWQLETFGNTMEPKVFTVNVGEGTASVTASQNGGSKSWYWTITSVGTRGKAQRKIKVTVFNFSLWNLNMGLGSDNSLASGGNGLLGTTSIDGPFYVRGNVELSGNSKVTGGPFFIKSGTLRFMDNSSTLGEPSNTIEAYIEPADGNYTIVNKSGSPLSPGPPQVNTSLLSNSVPDIKLPPIDPLESYRTKAASESVGNCTAYPGIINVQTSLNGYKVLDNDSGTSSGDPTGRPTYTIGNGVSSFGLENKKFAWDKNSSSLYVDGTIFVDGNLVIGDNQNSQTTYYGRGTIIVNGNIYINGKLRPPLNPTTGLYEMDGTHVLGLVTDNSIYINTSSGNSTPDRNNPDVSGAFFASNSVKMTANNTSFVGSMIAGILDFAGNVNNSHIFTDDSLPDFLPPSLPGSTKFLTMTTSWREVN